MTAPFRIDVRGEFLVVLSSTERRETRATGEHESASGRRVRVDGLSQMLQYGHFAKKKKVKAQHESGA